MFTPKTLRRAAYTLTSLLALALPAAAQLSGGPAGDLVLHGGTGGSGASYPVSGAIPNLSTVRFNDQVSSITVGAGIWELCTDSNYRGRCEIVDSSRANLAALGLNNNISSVRPASARPAPAPRPERPAPSTDGAIVFHSESGLRGRAVALDASQRDFNRLNFNDRARSVTVNSGVWRLCSDGGFSGNCIYVDKNVRNLGDIGLSGAISSAELSPYAQAPDRYNIALFQHQSYNGKFLGFDEGVADLSSMNFNDTASSVVVTRGSWLLCEDADYRGDCEVVDASERDLSVIALNDRITSFRRYDLRREGPRRRGDRVGDDGGTRRGLGNGTGREGRGGRNGRRGQYDGGFEGERAVFFPAPAYRGERIRNGSGVATRFCRDQGFSEAVYKGNGRVLSDVLCR